MAVVQVLGLAERGLVRPGYHADLVLFDPAAIIDRASYEDPEVATAGIDCVLVNGEDTYEAGVLTGRLPGSFLAD